MHFTAATLLDILSLAVLVFTAAHFLQRGFVASLLDLVGNFGALALAWFASQKLSPTVFDDFFKSGLITKTAQTIQQQGAVNLEAILDGLSGILPQSFIDNILASASGTLDSTAPDVAQQVVEQIVAPLVVPIISVVVFFAVFVVCRVLVSFLIAALSNVNRLPLVGGVNKFFGMLLGLVGGAINVVLLLCLVWGLMAITSGKVSFLSDEVLSGSWFYATFSKYNPFL